MSGCWYEYPLRMYVGVCAVGRSFLLYVLEKNKVIDFQLID